MEDEFRKTFNVRFLVYAPNLDGMSDFIENIITKAVQEAIHGTIITWTGGVKAVQQK